MPARPVDQAMNAGRPQKNTMRELWANEVEAFQEVADEQTPLFLTLSGAEGRDIDVLVGRGIIRRTETGAIDPRDQSKVVAIESSPDAELALLSKFPGLRTYQQAFQDLIRGVGVTSFPERKIRAVCRARVVNLDLTRPLHGEVGEHGELGFPVLTWIKKLCQIHTEAPRVDWSLCLTLNAEIPWSGDVCGIVSAFLTENFVSEPRFRELTKGAIGEQAFTEISQAGSDFAHLSPEVQQRLLMVFVPKKIAQLVHGEGWLLRTQYNLAYGEEGEAPMVSFVFRLVWDPRYESTPRAVYRDSLLGALETCGTIDREGNIHLN